MKTPLLLEKTGFHQLANRFSIIKIRQTILEASRRLEMLFRSRVPHPNPLDTKQYLNRYEFRERRPIVVREGRPQLTMLEFVLNSVDLTFVRHAAAATYRMRNTQPIHDPPNLYAIHLWRTCEQLHHEEATELLKDRRRGREARELLGLQLQEVPQTYTVLTRNLERLGDEVLFKITKGLFWILAQAGFFAGDVYLAGDSQLVPTFSRFLGCNGFGAPCARLSLRLQEVKAAVEACLMELQQNQREILAKGVSSQRHAVKLICPFGVTAGKNKRPLDVRLAWLRLFPLNSREFGTDQSIRWGIYSNGWLQQHGLGFRLEGCEFEEIKPDLFQMRCPRYPSDSTARIGWKNGNQPDADPIPVFGADLEQLTFLVPELGLELPFGLLGDHGNAPTRLEALLRILDDTGNMVRPIAGAFDARYDKLENYKLLRARGIDPIIDLIHHKQEASEEATRKRGVTMEGVALAYCGAEMKPNGFDRQTLRRSFVCGQQRAPETCARCPYGPQHSQQGQVKKVSVAEYPRYTLEHRRGSPDYDRLYDNRTASERTHADLEQTTPMAVVKPRLRGVRKLAANAGHAHHILLWRRIFNFITDIERLNHEAGRYQCAVDDAVLVHGVSTLHQLRSAQIRASLPSPFS